MAAAATLAVLGGTAEGAIAQAATLPQLASIGNPPASIDSGSAFTARVRVVNRSRRVSGRAVVTFKLVPPSGRHIALRGQLSVRALRPRAQKSAGRLLTVPPTAAAGAYRVMACLKGTRVCRASRRSVNVRTDAAVMLAAGDIAMCPTAGSGAEATAQLLDSLPSDVIAPLGDLAYENGTSAEFTSCYDPTWGRHKGGQRPAIGNREYNTAGASGYFTYFGNVAGQPGEGYYSYDVGNWHVVVLNSNCAQVSCAAASTQAAWLTQDLQAHRKTCTLAYWHHPLFASVASTVNADVAPLWQILDSEGVDVLLAGHAHIYERWKAQTSAGIADPNGVRQWIVGTGGYNHHAIDVNPKPANSEVRNADTFGVLELKLRSARYDWRFIPVAGGPFTDSGSDTCR